MPALHRRDHPGPEPCLLLVHAFPFDGRMWEPQTEALSGRFRLLVPDLAGFGSSPLRTTSFSLEDQARSLADLLDGVGVESAVLCGLSMGGYVALAFAALFPERLRGLVLADTRAGADSEEARSVRTETARRAREEGVAFLAESLPEKLLSPATLGEKPDLVAFVRSLMRRQDGAGVSAALLAMGERPDRTAELARIACPTLVLCGEFDALSPPAEMRAMAEAIPGARYAEIPSAGHLSNLENPRAFDRELRAFLARMVEGRVEPKP